MRAKSSPAELDALCGLPIAALRAVAGDEMLTAALAIVRTRLRLTPEKLATLIVRHLNPDEILSQSEGQKARGISAPTIRGMKQRGEIPKVCGGLK